jgi:molybdenum cofactor biosynthesis enzyme MoaA
MHGVNDMEVPGFVDLARRKQVSIRFIEYMPFDDNAWSTKKLVSSDQLLDQVRAVEPEVQPLRGHLSDTARSFAGPGWRGDIGCAFSVVTLAAS